MKFLTRSVEKSWKILVDWVKRRWSLRPLEMMVVIDYFVHEESPSTIARKYNVPRKWVRSVIRMYYNRAGLEAGKLVRAVARQYIQ